VHRELGGDIPLETFEPEMHDDEVVRKLAVT
jgi:hypothetical protein